MKYSLSLKVYGKFANISLNQYSYLQILPVGKKSSNPLQFSMFHVLPNSFIPFANIPLDVLISNKNAYYKVLQEKAFEEAKIAVATPKETPSKN